MAEHAKMASIDPQQRASLPECSWHDLSEPGAHVERGTGEWMNRAIRAGSSPR